MGGETKTILKYVYTTVIFYLTAASVALADTTYVYLVHTSKVPLIAISALGRKSAEQPLWITKVLTSTGTTDALIEVTAKDVTEENQLFAWDISGKIELVSVDVVETHMERGENVTRRMHTVVKELPPDIFWRSK